MFRWLSKIIILLVVVVGIGECCLATAFVFNLKQDFKVADDTVQAKNDDNENKEYEECLVKEYNNEEYSLVVQDKMEKITNLIKTNNYHVAVKYKDLVSGFIYEYNPNKEFYGASLIKLVDALYLINKAIDGEIDLDQEKVLYKSKYISSFSEGMAKRRVGEYVSLRDLITYAISVSDNTAHLMLLDYIGFNNLRDYGRGLGASSILTYNDNFGNQTVNDTTIYLEEAYRIIKENEEYGAYLKSIMDNDHRNDFNTDSIRIYHKYGSWDIYYHDIGLNLDSDYPYAISILTLHEKSNHKEIIQKIHEEIRELQDVFYQERIKSCELIKG